MKTLAHTCAGTCSRQILISLNDDNTISDVQFIGGCHGNTQGISRLVQGMKAEEVVARLKGTQCRDKGTSCPDQLACALQTALNK
ncbi:MAG: TIGR03905 family TSCPD domain-containing protein [Bacteroidaceae bacterium]|nr:TIGR03905 family TSCPD domain-containing protein [Bacteroidaceae bacterium]